jgi:hypothetical protein
MTSTNVLLTTTLFSQHQSCDLYELDILGIKSIYTFFYGIETLYANDHHGSEIEDSVKQPVETR